MALDTSIYGRIQQFKVASPGEVERNALAIENARQANRMNALKFDEMERARAEAAADQETLRAYFQAGGGEGNLNALNVRPGLRMAEEKRLLEAAKQREEAAAKRATTGKTTQETSIAAANRRANLLRGATDQQSWTMLRDIIGQEMGPDTLARVPEQFNPQLRDAMLQATVDEEKRLQLQQAGERDRRAAANAEVLIDAQGRATVNPVLVSARRQAAEARRAPVVAPVSDQPMPNDRTQLSAQLGVPVAQRDPFANMSGKGREVFQRELYKQADKKLTEADEGVSAATAMARDAQRFLQLQGNVTMQGPVAGRVPAFSDAAQEMDAITARITPQMRQPGSGATSDFDAKMFQMATVGRTKNTAANESIANGIIANARNAEARAQFMRDYVTVNGHLDGADREWRRYMNANPIFDPASPNTPKLNESRRSYQDFFGGAQQGAPNFPPLDAIEAEIRKRPSLRGGR
jgi:hypothetical protein